VTAVVVPLLCKTREPLLYTTDELIDAYDLNNPDYTYTNAISDGYQPVQNEEQNITLGSSNDFLLVNSEEFNIENPEVLTEERTYITKKLISLMNGKFIMNEDHAKFSLETYKNSETFSYNTLKKIKGKKKTSNTLKIFMRSAI
jgi:hypothetical protein